MKKIVGLVAGIAFYLTGSGSVFICTPPVIINGVVHKGFCHFAPTYIHSGPVAR